MRKWLAFSCVFLGTAAAAQPAPEVPATAVPPLIPQWAEVETVEVHTAPGPALWHVTKGDSEVWILGMIGGLPKGVTFNSKHLGEVMQGSRAIITPPRAKIDLLDIGWFLLGHCCSLFRLDNGRLDDILPEPTKLRLASMRDSVSGDAKLYQGDAPMGAANRLNRDFNKKYDFYSGDNPMAAVLKLAGKYDVENQPAFRFDPMPVIREAIKLTPQQQRPCLDTAMEDLDRQSHHAHEMAEAWAVGDIRGVKEHYADDRTTDCLAAAVHAFGALEQNRVPAFVAAIDAALDKPGKSFAVVGIGPLLRKGGVLERLEAQHLTIEGPPE